ncbi:MAG: hypothetical protein JOZ27_06800 [Caulobacteraceae bacterium]|nr:hypothetical protein [Caulobacteraceae bacterium]
MLATLVMTALYVLIWPPVYVAKVELIGEGDRDASRAGFYQSWAVFRKDQLSDEVQLFTAPPVLFRVVHELKLKDGDVYHPVFGYLGYLWNESLPGQWYHRVKSTLFPRKRTPFTDTPEHAAEVRTVEDLKAGVQLDTVMETDLGNLTVKGPSPRVAEIANKIATVYLDYRKEGHKQEAQAAYDALNGELNNTRAELTDLEARMKRYYGANNILLTFEKDKLDVGQAATLQASIADLKSSIAAGEQSLAQIDRDLAHQPREVLTVQVIQRSPLVDTLRASLLQLQLSRKQTLLHYRPDSPEVAEIDRQIAIQTDQLAREPAESVSQKSEALNANRVALETRRLQIRTDLEGQRASLAVREKEYGTAHSQLLTIPEKMMMVHDLDREHTGLETKFAALQEKVMTAAVSRATIQSAPSSIRVISFAGPPEKPMWPKPIVLAAAATVVGLVAGMLAALIADLFDDRVRRDRLGNAAAPGDLYAVVAGDRSATANLLNSMSPWPRVTSEGRPRTVTAPGPKVVAEAARSAGATP